MRHTFHPEAHRRSTRVNYTWDDFVALDEDDPRELFDGELLEVDVPTWLHEWIVSRLLALLSNWATDRRAGLVIGSGYKVKISEKRGAMPDVQFFRNGRPLPPNQALDRGPPPDLVAEVVSPSSGRYDRVEKLNYYALRGVPEYWVIDGELRTLVRHVLEPGKGYRIADALAGDAVFAPDGFDGLSIPLDDLWNVPEWFREQP